MRDEFGLVMSRGPQPGQTFPLDKDSLRLGRDPDNDIVIIDPQVSRRHARITRQGELMVIEDLESRNGTFVNGVQLVGPHILASGDVIGLGDAVVFTYYGADIVMAETLPGRPTVPPVLSGYEPPAPPPLSTPPGFGMTTNILLYGLVCLVIGAMGLYLSYGPWTSASWYWAYGAFPGRNGEYQNLGGWREFVRLVVLLLFFVIAQRWVFTEEARKYWRAEPKLLSFYRYLFACGPKWLCILCIVAAGIIVVYHAALGPIILLNEYADAIAPFPLSFEEHFRPHLGYLPYTLALYILIALPMFIVIVEGMIADRKRVRCLAEPIYAVGPGSLVDGEKIELQVKAIEKSFLDVREQITEVAGKYIYMALLVIIYYGIEIGSGLILQLACWAQELTKWSAWLFIIAILPYFIITSFRMYTGVYASSQDALRGLAGRALELQDGDTLGSVNKLRSEFESKYTVLSFILSLAKSGSVAVVVFLLVAGSTYKYLESSGQIEPRRIVQTAIPWPVCPVVLIGADLLKTPPSSAVGGTGQEGFDWGPRCEMERPDENLEWRGERIIDR